ncbi:MAG: phenylalanine--tRNA ligase subunit beta [Candidatus Dependentiae bacterium]|nr:phenylalanine--tRNA ligase subunit beta [Candidatus Dependentiae bacterium]
MKISIAWLFDHINADKNTINVSHLVERFNQVTAEIEGCEKVELPINAISLAQIITSESESTLAESITLKTVIAKSTEWGIECSLPYRTDSCIGNWFLIYKNNDDTYRWVTIADIGGAKDGLMPALYVDKNLYAGEWKQHIEKTDYILNVDNKSLTHRPDMWGHRGFAREIAAIFNLPLKPLDECIAKITHKQEPSHGVTGDIRVTIAADTPCDRFSALYIPSIERKPSLLWMALRLARVDSKPIDAIVDFTNYVMLDTSQPMHAFDADTLPNKTITARKANNKEHLTLLDGTSIELSSNDMVISSDTDPIALAGIMGGASTAINNHTKSLLLESAHFDATTIRLTAARHKKRTEASTRFEKNSDPFQNVIAIERFLKLCDDAQIDYTLSGPLLSLGTQNTKSTTITIEHSFIEQRLGVSIDSSFIRDILHKLSCIVTHTHDTTNTVYTIAIPTFRATKDICIQEDIVEEIGRFYGYGNIPLALPLLQLNPKDMRPLMRMRAIKRLLSEACNMRELYTYAFYDESFLRRLSWEPENSLSVQNPVSENWQRLVTSLIPNMIKAVESDSAHHDQLRFFELARVWNPIDSDTHEKEMLTGIIFDKKNEINFYEAKQVVEKICDLVPIDTTWVAVETPEQPWLTPYKTARIMHDGQCLGVAGMVPELFLHKLTEGHAFVFELDAALLRTYKKPIIRYKASSKYPTIDRDISMLVPLAITVEQVTHLIYASDKRIQEVTLIDFFEKKEWLDKRSLTLRFTLCDEEKTMKKEEVDAVVSSITAELIKHNVVIR